MRIFDTHAHVGLIHEDTIEQLLIIQESRQNNIAAIINICNNIDAFFTHYENLKNSPIMYFAIGVSPSEVMQPGNDWEIKIQRGCQLPRVVAIGEAGLDYYRKFGNKDAQVELFIRQLKIANKLELPIIVHNRDAGADVLSILKDNIPSRGAVLHCYSENWSHAEKALELNVRISLAGSVTYRKAKHLHEVAKHIPSDRLLIESESPFIVPSAFRGQRNMPKNIIETINAIAEIRNTSPEEIAETSYINACNFFNVPAE